MGMALLRGGLYYTRSKKVNGRVVREYFGSGLLGQLAAAEDERERQKKAETATFEREARERLDGLTEPVGELCEAAETLARAALIAGGYRRHKRGEWRKSRVEDDG